MLAKHCALGASVGPVLTSAPAAWFPSRHQKTRDLSRGASMIHRLKPNRRLAAFLLVALWLSAALIGCGGGGGTTPPGPGLGDLTAQRTAALTAMNTARSAAGVSTVTLDDLLNTGAQAHANYLLLNKSVPGLNVHDEDPSLPGYTPEGDAAAAASNISRTTVSGTSPPGAGEAAVFLINVPYHRINMLRSSLAEIGVGFAYDSTFSATVINVITGIVGSERPEPVLYPASGQTNVPTTFAAEESPDPLPPGAPRPAGYPITAQFPTGASITSVTASLHRGATTVATYNSDPENPANSARPTNSYAIFLIPQSPLAANTAYTVIILATVNATPYNQTWNFTTGTITFAVREPARNIRLE